MEKQVRIKASATIPAPTSKAKIGIADEKKE